MSDAIYLTPHIFDRIEAGPIPQSFEHVVDCDNTAFAPRRLAQLLKGGIGRLLDERVQLLHLRVIQCGWIVCTAQRLSGSAAQRVSGSAAQRGRCSGNAATAAEK